MTGKVIQNAIAVIKREQTHLTNYNGALINVSPSNVWASISRSSPNGA